MKDDPIRIIPHSQPGIPDTGSFEVRFSDGRQSVYFYWDDNPGRRAITLRMSSQQAKKAAQKLARSEQDQSKR